MLVPGLLSMLSYIPQGYLLKFGTTHSELPPPIILASTEVKAIAKQMVLGYVGIQVQSISNT